MVIDRGSVVMGESIGDQASLTLDILSHITCLYLQCLLFTLLFFKALSTLV